MPHAWNANDLLLRDFRVQPGWDGLYPKPSPPVLKKGLTGEFGAMKPAFDDVGRWFGDTPPMRQERIAR